MIRIPLIAGSLALALTLALSLGTTARASEAGDRHAVWQGCLDRNFGVQAVLTSRVLAADAAVRACRDAEKAYLAALATSPLLDAEEATEARPALLARARNRLLGRRAAL